MDDFSLDIEDYDEVEKTALFSDFLYNSSIKPVWYAYKYGMNIEREFELEAYSKISTLLQKGGLSQKPIIILDKREQENQFLWRIWHIRLKKIISIRFCI